MEKRFSFYQRRKAILWFILVAVATIVSFLGGGGILYILSTMMAFAIAALIEGFVDTVEKKHHKCASPIYYEIGVIAVSPSGKHRVGTDLWIRDDEEELLAATTQVNDDGWAEVPLSMVTVFVCPIKGSLVGLSCFTDDDIQGIINHDGSIYRWFVNRVKKMIPDSGPVDWQKIATTLSAEQPGYSVRIGPRTY